MAARQRPGLSQRVSLYHGGIPAAAGQERDRHRAQRCRRWQRNAGGGSVRHTHPRRYFTPPASYGFGFGLFGACVKAEAAADFSRAVDVGSLNTLLAALAAFARVCSCCARTCVSADAAADFSRALECGSLRTLLAADAALEPVVSGFRVAMLRFPFEIDVAVEVAPHPARTVLSPQRWNCPGRFPLGLASDGDVTASLCAMSSWRSPTSASVWGRLRPLRDQMLRRFRPLQVSSPFPKSERIAPGLSSGCACCASSSGLGFLLASRVTLGLRQAHSASNCPIRQPLADHAQKKLLGALLVSPSVRLAMVVPEIKLGYVALKVVMAAMLIDALHAALEDREEAFDGVTVNVGLSRFTYSPAR
jgi:hypothetical protein